jgi:hypothetical protein
MNVETEIIQPGWSVICSDGEELGSVISVDANFIHVKKGGILGGELTIPRARVTDVETGRVELSMTKSEASASKS